MLIIYRILNHITFAQKHPKVPLSCQTRCRSLVMHLVPEMTVLTSAFLVEKLKIKWGEEEEHREEAKNQTHGQHLES